MACPPAQRTEHKAADHSTGHGGGACRPRFGIGDLVSTLHYDRLVEDAREVLRTLAFRETEVQGEGDAWYLMRILPYRTTDNVIDGLVLTFVDITVVRALQQGQRRLLDALKNSPTRVFGLDRDLRARPG